MDNSEKKTAGFTRHCENCGAKFEQGSVFCEQCGAKLPTGVKRTQNFCKAAIDFCKRNKVLVLIAGGLLSVFVFIALIFIVVLCIPNRIDFTDYIITSVDGYSGYGEFSATLDYDALAEKVLGDMPDPDKKESYDDYLEYIQDVNTLKNSLYIRVEKSDTLKNGDFVIVTVHISNAEYFEDQGYDISEDKQSVTLEIGEDTDALEEPIIIDIFEKVQILFTGTNGSGRASVGTDEITFTATNSEGEEIVITAQFTSPLWGYDCFEFRKSGSDNYVSANVDISSDSGLSNGDVITITIVDNPTLAQMFGIRLSSYEKEYTVSGLE